MNVLFVEDGQMDKRVFLATWKEIPAQNEVQYTITNIMHTAGNFLKINLVTMNLNFLNLRFCGSKDAAE